MNMNDILSQWDNLQKDREKKQKESGRNQVSHKKANAPTKEEKEIAKARLSAAEMDYFAIEENTKSMNSMELWLRRYGTIDKDRIQEENEERQKRTNINYLINMKIQSRIDLHGLTKDEAEERLSNFISDCVKKGMQKVLIVHGKGIHSHGSDPVLGEMVKKFIERDKRLGISGHPDKNMGGSGATWVIIK